MIKETKMKNLDSTIVAALYPFEDNFGKYSRRDNVSHRIIDYFGTPDYVLRQVVKNMEFEMRTVSDYSLILKNHMNKSEVIVHMFKNFNKDMEKAANHRIYWRAEIQDFLKVNPIQYAYSETDTRIIATLLDERYKKNSYTEIALIKEYVKQEGNDYINRVYPKMNKSTMNPMTRALVASLPGLSEEVISLLIADDEVIVQQALANSIHVSDRVLASLNNHTDHWVKYLVAIQENTTLETLNVFIDEALKIADGSLSNNESKILSEVLQRDKISSVRLEEVADWVDKFSFNKDFIDFDEEAKIVMRGMALNPNISYLLLNNLVEKSVWDFELSFNLIANKGVPKSMKNIVIAGLDDCLSHRKQLISVFPSGLIKIL